MRAARASRVSEQEIGEALALIDRMAAEAEGGVLREVRWLQALGERAEGEGWDFTPTIAAAQEAHARLQRRLAACRGMLSSAGAQLRGVGVRARWAAALQTVAQELGRKGFRRGVPRETAAYDEDRTRCETMACGYCGLRRLTHVSFVRSDRMRQQYRGYAVCGRCGLLAELSVSASPVDAGAPPAGPERVETGPGMGSNDVRGARQRSGGDARRAVGVTVERDEEWGEWVRQEKDGERVLVADAKDGTPVQGPTGARCVLCRQQVAHSAAYHAVLLEKERRRGGGTEGTVWVVPVEPRAAGDGMSEG